MKSVFMKLGTHAVNFDTAINTTTVENQKTDAKIVVQFKVVQLKKKQVQ